MYDYYSDDIYNDVDDFLEHHGVKGQKWGVRRARKSSGGSRSSSGKSTSGNTSKNKKPFKERARKMISKGGRWFNRNKRKLAIGLTVLETGRELHVMNKAMKSVSPFADSVTGTKYRGNAFSRLYSMRPKRKSSTSKTNSYSQANRHMKDLRKAYQNTI